MRKCIISLALLSLSALSFADTVQLRPDAPQRYTVKKGDTLWDISAKFLKSPWKWPTVWGMNKDEIKNPHWIYPGDEITLDQIKKRLNLHKAKAPSVVKLSPHIRVEPLDGAIFSISYKAIAPFLKRPLILTQDEYLNAPKVVAGPDERSILSQGDLLYSERLQNAGTWQVFRPGKVLKDPVSKEILGYEAIYGGDAEVEKQAKDVTVLKLLDSPEEIEVGDRLLRYMPTEIINTVPHIAESSLKGQVISIFNGLTEAGPLQTIAINRGTRDGVEVGHVFGIFKKTKFVSVPKRETNVPVYQHMDDSGQPNVMVEDPNRTLEIPAEQAGKLFIYRVFDKVSYGLTLDTRLPINVEDTIQSPE